jgi:hypothetical protein
MITVTVPVIATPVATPVACYTFYNNLGLNQPISTADASALQQVLAAQGLWNASNPITAYTREVEIAVTALQERYTAQILTPNGLTQGTGYFGPSTRSVLNQIYGCSTNANGISAGVTGTGVTNTGTTISSETSSQMTSGATITSNGQTFTCPTGWTCVPPATSTTIVTCPAGWTCTPPTLTNGEVLNPFNGGVVYPVTTTATSTTYISATTTNYAVNPNSFFTLASQPVITKENVTAGAAATTSMLYTATFNVNVDAVTGNLTLGLPGSTQPAFPINSNSVAIYKNGAEDSLSNYEVNVSYSQPSGSILSSDGESFSISQGQTVTVPVTYTFLVNGISANTYAVQLQGIYSSLGLINSMTNQPTWRTNSI